MWDPEYILIVNTPKKRPDPTGERELLAREIKYLTYCDSTWQRCCCQCLEVGFKLRRCLCTSFFCPSPRTDSIVLKIMPRLCIWNKISSWKGRIYDFNGEFDNLTYKWDYICEYKWKILVILVVFKGWSFWVHISTREQRLLAVLGYEVRP